MVMPGGLSVPPHWNTAPPQSVTSKPRWSRYQALSAFGSADLKKIPPTPVTRFMVRSKGGLLIRAAKRFGLNELSGAGLGVLRALPSHCHRHCCQAWEQDK